MIPILIQLTCRDEIEANLIIDELLSKKLIACAKTQKVISKFLWKDKIEHSEEVLLVMDSVQEKFVEIDKIVESLHSYGIYNLVATKIDLINSKIENWLGESLKK
jgi:periplasmic divalent cation tolerance protein